MNKKIFYFLALMLLGICFAASIRAQEPIQAKPGDVVRIEIHLPGGDCEECLVGGRWDEATFKKELAWRLEAIKLRTDEIEFFLDPKTPSESKQLPAIPPQPTRTDSESKVFTSSVAGGVVPVVIPDDSDQVQAKAAGDRVMAMAKRVAKSLLKAKLAVEKRKLPRRRDDALIQKLEFAIEADELIELELEESVNEYKSTRANASELGDGQLFRDFLDFIGNSEKFGSFIDNLIKLIDKIFELIGGLA